MIYCHCIEIVQQKDKYVKSKTGVGRRGGQVPSDWTDAARKNWVNRTEGGDFDAAAPPLMHWLAVAAAERGMNLRGLAAELKVTYGYILQLRGGLRKLSAVSDKFVEEVTRFLNLPRISVLAACGRVTLEDFVPAPSLEHSIARAYAFIERDATWGAVMPSSLKVADREAKLFVIRLYEAATGTVLIPYSEPSADAGSPYVAHLKTKKD